ncbi:MAG: 5'/3'-nucleotidase SurE [Deltaproteobacteria bacterium]|nr:5'/3'-nucleotidase SurE [Deltaproteobacteria bacterium]
MPETKHSTDKRPLVLVSNDDGVWAPGIRALADSMRDMGAEVIVSAPDREQSAMGHALTVSRPLQRIEVAPGVTAWDGTPTDAVIMGVNVVLEGRTPDLVVSGINHGQNLGDDVTYSGTVSAAMEGCILGIPSVAFSLATKALDADYGPASKVAADVARWVLTHGLPPDTLLNVNIPAIPAAEIRGSKITIQGRRRYEQTVKTMEGPFNRKVYWIAGEQKVIETHDHADFNAVKDGFVSITPLHLNMTHFAALKMIVHIPTAFDK